MTCGDWLRLLHENRYDVDFPYWPRIGTITGSTVLNSLWRAWEDRRYGRQIAEAVVHPPLFVLGIWRSGTTHLHNLLAHDERFAFPNTYQVNNPHTFLTTEGFQSAALQFWLPKTRPQDNVRFGVQEPQEDEFALCGLTGYSILMSLAFPRRSDHYMRYLSFDNVPEEEIARWKAALLGFVRKLSLKYGRPLVLKSPGHTCRIRLLLEVFPEARFVHIHRHPYEVFQSTRHMSDKIRPWVSMQRWNERDLEAEVIRQQGEFFDAFFAQRDLIPAGRFHELGFADLERDPLGEQRRLYAALELPDFNVAEPALREYLASLGEYKRNTFAPLQPEVKAQLSGQCRRCFDEWGYSAD